MFDRWTGRLSAVDGVGRHALRDGRPVPHQAVRVQGEESTRWVPQPPFSTRPSTLFMRRSNSSLTLACAAGRLRSAAASFSRPRTKRGPSAYEAACLDGARGNSVLTSLLSGDTLTS